MSAPGAIKIPSNMDKNAPCVTTATTCNLVGSFSAMLSNLRSMVSVWYGCVRQHGGRQFETAFSILRTPPR